MTSRLTARIAAGLARETPPEVVAFAHRLGENAKALGVLFYGSNLRTGSLDGVLDYYVLLPGPPERGIWPRISYHEWQTGEVELRAKVATMTLAKFVQACSGKLLDTTIWARFVQPSALVWQKDAGTAEAVGDAIARACITAARLAVAQSPRTASERTYWTGLFEETYRAEFRIETASRAHSILDLNGKHFEGLLPLALDGANIAYQARDGVLTPALPDSERIAILRWWKRRRRLGKPINVLRLMRAAFTFDGAARYAAWKIERHSGVQVKVTPWREKHPLLAAPGVLFSVWRNRRGDRA